MCVPILLRVGKVAYDLNLLIEGIGVKDYLSYEEIPVQILDKQVKKLRNKEVAFVKEL